MMAQATNNASILAGNISRPAKITHEVTAWIQHVEVLSLVLLHPGSVIQIGDWQPLHLSIEGVSNNNHPSDDSHTEMAARSK